ncbi:hypothetical protein HDF24_25550 [Mucilaginibacter sp. X4EP1]|uniref:hypothetical protein n=1 Tax=Mucilaginibacter sp. X4EP1 TaxID=2723092 RepID=UPI00216A5160|nr:hypothetical protein [Mucilaginibacter sp. X4EP1]MCS3816571.1 hypothetical protein [Mucilaginibacter sp. X4EP1]
MKRHFLFFIIIFATCTNAFSQVSGPTQPLPNYDPPSPEASALGKYVDQPVGYFTGTPKIDLPLFEIRTGRITIPISISYHGSGIKVNDIASRVGSGWVLNAGGVITRTVKGFPDDGGLDLVQPSGTNVVPYFQGGGSNSMSVTPPSTLTTVYDLEPDEYFYNFGGNMGKMYFANQTKPVLCNDDPLIVSGPFNGSNSFIITDEKGIIYTFQNTEVTQDLTGGVSYTYTSSWFLTQIFDPVTNKTVTFQYNTSIPSLNYSYTKTLTASPPCGPAGAYNASQVKIQQSQVLSKIIYDNGYIQFATNLNRQDLTGDVAYTNISQYATVGTNSTLIKSYNLAYSTISTGSGKQEGYRLYLNSLQQSGSDGTLLPPYSFYYKNANTLPDRFSAQQDIWGYYNANGAATTDPPQYPKVFIHNEGSQTDYLPFDNPFDPATQTLSGVDCSSNSATVDAGTLNKIVYPTQGYTTYSFESNSFGPYTGGGIRIKEIDNYSASGQLLLYKTYQYGYGALGGPYPQVAYPTNGLGVLRFSFNQTVLGSSQGSYVGYGMVTETQNGTDGTNNGSIVYNYSTTPDVPGVFTAISNTCLYLNTLSSIQTESYFPFFEMESREARRGALIEQDYYDPSGNPRKSVYYNYTLSSNPLIKVYSSYMTYDPAIPGSILVNLNQSRMINAEKMLLTNKVENDYDAPTPDIHTPSISKNTFYTYCGGANNDQFKQSETLYQSQAAIDATIRGNLPDYITTTSYKYPFDYAASTSGGVMGNMVAMNYISPVINELKTITRQYNTSPVIYYTGSKFTNYIQNPSYTAGSQPNMIVPGQVFVLNIPSPIQQSTTSGNSAIEATDPSNPGSLYESRLQYLNYDNNSNLIDLAETSGPHVSYQWGYNHQYVVAKVQNAPGNDIFYDSFEDGDGNSASGDAKTGNYSFYGSYLENLTGLNVGTYVLSYWIKSGGIWSFVLNNTVSVTGSTYTITIGSPGTQIDDVRFYPINAQMTTYTYAIPFGITSKTDPKGEITYYEYDVFQRLVNIKDQYGNIIKSYCYNYAGQAFGCNINVTGSSSGSSSGSQTTPYVQMTLSSTSNSTDANGNGQVSKIYTMETFSDVACTIPYTLPTGLTVNYQVNTSTTYTSQGQTGAPIATSTSLILTMPAGTSQRSTNSIMVNGCTGTSQKGNCSTSTVVLVAGTGYLLGNGSN